MKTRTHREHHHVSLLLAAFKCDSQKVVDQLWSTSESLSIERKIKTDIILSACSFHHGRLLVCASDYLCKVLISVVFISSTVIWALCIHLHVHQGCIWLLSAREKARRIWSTKPTLMEVNPEPRVIILPPHGFHWEFQHLNLTLFQACHEHNVGCVYGGSQDWVQLQTLAPTNMTRQLLSMFLHSPILEIISCLATLECESAWAPQRRSFALIESRQEY